MLCRADLLEERKDLRETACGDFSISNSSAVEMTSESHSAASHAGSKPQVQDLHRDPDRRALQSKAAGAKPTFRPQIRASGSSSEDLFVSMALNAEAPQEAGSSAVESANESQTVVSDHADQEEQAKHNFREDEEEKLLDVGLQDACMPGKGSQDVLGDNSERSEMGQSRQAVPPNDDLFAGLTFD